MKNQTNRNAKFYTSACLILSFDEIYICGGACQGTILHESNATIPPGLPLSAYFVPTGYTSPISELDENEKIKISHRGIAIKKITNILKNTLKY
jgi:XTP/dITP diphosphohydrolase